MKRYIADYMDEDPEGDVVLWDDVVPLLKALESIAGYWNRDERYAAMAFACWHAVAIAEQAIAKATGD